MTAWCVEGRGWTGSLDVDGRHVVAGHAPILADDGRLVGLAIAEAEYPSVRERLTDAAPDLALFLGLGAALGLGGSLLLSRSFKRSTRGLRAEEIATLADHREALLDSIREGVVAVAPDGRVSVLNDSAQALLGLTDDAVGRPVADLGLDRQVGRAADVIGRGARHRAAGRRPGAGVQPANCVQQGRGHR